MPNAQTHDIITVVSATGANVAYFQAMQSPKPSLAVLFTATYLFAGYACAGDLDLDSKEYRRWGPLRVLWWPYRKLVPHRSWISHGLVLGGLVRLCYLAVLCMLLFWGALSLYAWYTHQSLNTMAITQERWFSVVMLMKARPLETAALLGGFILAGTTHSLADIIFSWFKRRF